MKNEIPNRAAEGNKIDRTASDQVFRIAYGIEHLKTMLTAEKGGATERQLFDLLAEALCT